MDTRNKTVKFHSVHGDQFMKHINEQKLQDRMTANKIKNPSMKHLLNTMRKGQTK